MTKAGLGWTLFFVTDVGVTLVFLTWWESAWSCAFGMHVIVASFGKSQGGEASFRIASDCGNIRHLGGQSAELSKKLRPSTCWTTLKSATAYWLDTIRLI